VEADVIMTNVVQSGVKWINVVYEDKDVYVLLLFYAKLNLSCCFTTEGACVEETNFDIGATAREHGHLSQLATAHTLSECDTVAQCFGIGKCTIIKVLESGVELNKLGVIGGHR
jgi:hypothetical protein